MLQKILASSIGFLLYVLSAPMAQAVLMIDGSFSGSFSLGTLSGSFQSVFDDNLLITGNESFYNQQILTSLTLDPNPLGATIFDTTNVGMNLSFTNGVLDFALLGGLASGVAGLSTDDFTVSFFGSPEPPLPVNMMLFSASSPFGTFRGSTTDVTGSLSTSAIPEPATLALLSLGLVGLNFTRRKTKA